MDNMEQETVKAVLNDIVESVILLNDSLEKCSISKMDATEEAQGCMGRKSVALSNLNDIEAIEPYSLECSDAETNVNKSRNSEKKLELPETENKTSMPANIDPSVIVINNYLYESTSSDSDCNDRERRVHKSQSDDKVSKFGGKVSKSDDKASESDSSDIEIKRESSRNNKRKFKFSRQSLSRSIRKKSKNLPEDIEAPSTSNNFAVLSVINNYSDFEFKSKLNSEETIQILNLSESPGNSRRKSRQKLQVDIEEPSTSTNIVPSVIVINDFSNESSTSTHSTGEMQRRTERHFAFLSDSDFSEVEESRNALGYQNRAYEPSEEIEPNNEEGESINQTETNILVPELISISFNNTYIWSTTGLLKVAQVICCITMCISIGLCRFSNRYIQVYCIIGACISGFLLLTYSYRIDVVYWKSYKIRLLFFEFVYLIIYTVCDSTFAIIKFEFNQEANKGERIATMLLISSTGISAATHCYDAIFSYSL